MNNSLTTLHLSCRLGDLAGISLALAQSPCCINQRDPQVSSTQQGWSPLYRVVSSGNLSAARFLLSRQADPNLQTNLGDAPLHLAADQSHQANPNIQQNDGETPLHSCAFKGDTKMVQILLKHGASPNVQNFTVGFRQNLRTPLHFAVDCNFVQCALMMIGEGGDVFVRDLEGKNVLEMAASLEVEAVLKQALQRESSVASFVNPFSEVDAAEGTTYLISDLGDDRFSMTETHTQMPRPSAKASGDLKEIFSWLERIHLEQLYEILVEAGYDNSVAMAMQMSGPMPITEQDLCAIGITKPGHRKRILWKLEEDNQEKPRILQNSSIFRCCGQIRDGTGALVNMPNLIQILKEVNAEQFYTKFCEAGYEDYESIVALFSSKYAITSEELVNEVGIRENRVVKRVMNRISNDAGVYKQPGIVFDEGKVEACDLCIII
jgi:hypothetical protein